MKILLNVKFIKDGKKAECVSEVESEVIPRVGETLYLQSCPNITPEAQGAVEVIGTRHQYNVATEKLSPVVFCHIKAWG